MQIVNANETHSLVLSRLYHEDVLLTQRTYNFMTLNVFLGALAIIAQNQSLLMLIISVIAITLASFQIAFGRRMESAITFWRSYVHLIERKERIFADHLLFEFYEKAEVNTPWGKIRSNKTRPVAMYDTIPWSWVPSTNTIVGVFTPWLILILWYFITAIILWNIVPWLSLISAMLLIVSTIITWWWRVPSRPVSEENAN